MRAFVFVLQAPNSDAELAAAQDYGDDDADDVSDVHHDDLNDDMDEHGASSLCHFLSYCNVQCSRV